MPYALTTPTAEAAEPPAKVVIVWTPENTAAMAYEKAAKYHLKNPDIFVETMRRESEGFVNPAIQSHYIRADGTREPSFGDCQFYIPSVLKTADGTVVTKEIAVDPEQCLDAAAYNFSIGYAHEWTEYRLLMAGK